MKYEKTFSSIVVFYQKSNIFILFLNAETVSACSHNSNLFVPTINVAYENKLHTKIIEQIQALEFPLEDQLLKEWLGMSVVQK
ncbi:hypothetical protein KSF78_0000977 [Schistosoma japonicum]|nr:hypothetical protein KSF78_0000977 [Schistosoma japonicum]